MIIKQNFYQTSCDVYPQFPSAEAKHECEILIIGGGYAGLMTQLGLLERGKGSVCLLEAEEVGYGASGRNGGFVFGGYSLGLDAIAREVGPERARDLYSLTTDAVELIRQRVKTHHIDCELVEDGVIWANWFKAQSLLLDYQKMMKELAGVDWQYLNEQKLAELICSERYHGGLFEANAMHFQPFRYAKGIAQVIAEAGGQIFEYSPAISLEKSGKHWRVCTQKAEFRAKEVVLCAGGYIHHFYPRIARAILPIATYVMVTEAIPELLREFLKTDAAIYDTRFAFDYYRPLQSGRLLWGGRISAATQTPKNVADLLRTDMLKVFPGLKDVAIDYAWGGLMGYCRHQMPIIGRLNNGIWYNLGFGGHGVGPTTVGGEIIASAIAENDQRFQWFSPWQPDWAGGVFGPVAAQTSYWWYQFKDALKDMSDSFR